MMQGRVFQERVKPVRRMTNYDTLSFDYDRIFSMVYSSFYGTRIFTSCDRDGFWISMGNSCHLSLERKELNYEKENDS